MSRSAVVSLVVALLALFVANVWLAPDPRLAMSVTSFGTGRAGYAALFDLFTELEVPVTRSHEPFSRLGTGQPVWFVRPDFLGGEPEAREKRVAELESWIEGGGLAVIFGGVGSDWPFDLDSGRAASGDEELAPDEADVSVSGDLAPTARRVEPGTLRTFDAVPDDARVLLQVGGRAFALEIARGEGRAVLVADGTFLANRWLDEADASLLAVDLARAFGAPALDEYSHGFRAGSLWTALAGSRAWIALALLGLAGAIWVAAERRWPVRRLDGSDEPDPSLREFVASLGRLYARRSEPAAVFGVYREGVLRGLGRSALVGRPRPVEEVLAGLRGDAALDPEARRYVLEGERPTNERELVRAVAALERIRGGNR